MSNVELKSIALSNGERMGYRERENGKKVIVLVHGNMTSSKHWDILIDALPNEYKVYAIDLRGFGESSYNNKVTAINDFSEDLHLFVKAMNLHDFTLMGWSLGGCVAMQFTASYPIYVKELILLASGSTRGYPFFGFDKSGELTKRLETIKEVKQDPARTLPIQKAYDEKNTVLLKEIWNAAIYTNKQPSPEKYDEYVKDMTTQQNLAETYQALNLFNISDKDNGLGLGTGEARSIKVPTLVLYGENDLVVTKPMTDEIIADLSTNKKVVMLKDCGHSPLIDDLKQLVLEVDQFLTVEERRVT